VYPDCRPEFIASATTTLRHATNNPLFSVLAPYILESKADIAKSAFKLNVPLQNTWSCYVGGDVHCGRCGTCVERLEAIDEARSILFKEDEVWHNDNTIYDDNKFWKEAVANA
jgi:7-cyano-7-deazaguanine synthase